MVGVYPQLRLDFYETAVLMSRWMADGRVVTHPIAVADLVGACSQVHLRSGLLPPDVLFWRQRGDQTLLGVYVAAQRWRVQVEMTSGVALTDNAALTAGHIPLPPLLFVGQGTAYHIFAVRRRPLDEWEPLYAAPCPNVHSDGGICQGNTPFPVCAAESIHLALRLFLEGSAFNGHLSQGKSVREGEDVRRLWAKLDGRRRFPVGELVAMGRHLRDLL